MPQNVMTDIIIPVETHPNNAGISVETQTNPPQNATTISGVPVRIEAHSVAVVSRGKRVCTVFTICLTALTIMLMLSGFITEFVGISHARYSDAVNHHCPSKYWESTVGWFSLRIVLWLVFIVAAVVCYVENVTPYPTTLLIWGCIPLLMLTLANTSLTAQAWEAADCTRAMLEADRSADPLIAAGGSLLMIVDWIMLLTSLVWVAVNFHDQSEEYKDCNACCTDCRTECNPACAGACGIGCMVCMVPTALAYPIGSLVVYCMGLAYAFNKSECPSAFWPFAMTVFFLIPWIKGYLGHLAFQSDDDEFKLKAPCVGLFSAIVTLGLSIAAIVMASNALQSEECRYAMGNNGATGPLLSIGMIMYGVTGIVAFLSCVIRCVKLSVN